MRSIAYFFAGVPRNIYRVLQSLEELNYSDFGDTDDLPLLQAFREKLEQTPADPIFRSTIQAIETSLRCIDLLQGPIIGPQRAAFRQLFSDEAPLARIEDLSARYNQIRGRIRDLRIDDSALNDLQEDAVGLADSMQCLFALYAIRSRRTPEALRDTPTAKIIGKVTDDTTAQSLHDISLAGFFGAVFSYLLVEKVAFVLSDPNSPDRAALVRQLCADMLIPLIPSLLLLAFLTILFRHLRIDQASWPKPKLWHIPFWDYARLAFLPALCATFLYGLITCLAAEGVIRYALAGDFADLIEASAVFLEAEYTQLPRVFLLSFVTACGLLFVADQHDHMRWFVTVGAALLVSLFLWMVANLAASLFAIAPPGFGLSLEDMAIIVTLPFAVFLLLYAGAAELAETQQMRRVFSVMATPFRNQQHRG